MTECDLANKNCVPCRGGVPPLAGEELDTLHSKLGNGWDVVDGHHLQHVAPVVEVPVRGTPLPPAMAPSLCMWRY